MRRYRSLVLLPLLLVIGVLLLPPRSRAMDITDVQIVVPAPPADALQYGTVELLIAMSGVVATEPYSPDPAANGIDLSATFTGPAGAVAVNGFYEGANFLVINPDECIDCGACVPECPTEAIFPEDELPEKWAEYTELNARLAESWPVITERKDPLDDADEWKAVEEKRKELSEDPAER